MPAPTTFADLSTTAASNFPAGADNVFPSLDDTLRVHAACLASIMANTGNGWTSPYATAASPVFTGVASFPDGAAATPSITNTGDTNTGIWFPSADVIAFSTAGAEASRIDGDRNTRSYVGAAPPTLTTNGEMVFNLTTNTNLRVSVRGNDGVTRVADIALA